jgi:alpha-D-xyloside xylohydrolase
LPLFLAESGIVPLLRPTIDSLSPTTKPGTLPGEVDSYATTPGILWARVFLGKPSGFTLFDGATLTQADTGATVILTTKDGLEFNKGVIFEIIGAGVAPKDITIGNAAINKLPDLAMLEASLSGFAFAPERNGTLWIKVPAGAQTITVTR